MRLVFNAQRELTREYVPLPRRLTNRMVPPRASMRSFRPIRALRGNHAGDEVRRHCPTRCRWQQETNHPLGDILVSTSPFERLTEPFSEDPQCRQGSMDHPRSPQH